MVIVEKLVEWRLAGETEVLMHCLVRAILRTLTDSKGWLWRNGERWLVVVNGGNSEKCLLLGHFFYSESHINPPRLESVPLDKKTARKAWTVTQALITFLPEALIFQKHLRREQSHWPDSSLTQYFCSMKRLATASKLAFVIKSSCHWPFQSYRRSWESFMSVLNFAIKLQVANFLYSNDT
jgi:hypothetical protein